jgi:hypothetical protein
MPIMPPKKARQTPATTRLVFFFLGSVTVWRVIIGLISFRYGRF